MPVTDFTTEQVTAAERFPLWGDVTCQSHARCLLRSADKDDFLARMRLLDLGEIQLSALAFPHLQVARPSRLIRQGDPERYLVNCISGGDGSVSTSGSGSTDTGTTFRAGDVVMLDTSRPYWGDFNGLPDRWSHLVIQIPHTLVPLPEREVRRLLAVPFPAGGGMGGTFRRWLADLTQRADEFTPEDLPTLASVTTDLLTCLLARSLDAETAVAPESRRSALRVRVRDFIGRNLADPSLSPAGIAAAHHISVRHLYTLFEEDGTTPAAWIRARRLEHCRRDLADPALRHRPVHAVAARWGFTDPAHFSRIFRAAYGLPPRDWRQYACGDEPVQSPTSTVQKLARNSGAR
ncbi:helix-turn-helix domain-containing protein [Streptomyces sp. YIM 98790]|uniref:helix-turn-helix domain-containing protein n=1 Tax=Streptomyces sp. YIM 98790 TaxID=2689077 RepID=UPI001408EA06|nr:helix-turn-helix domain-containing protein [Streptomyces sp. YIM 98790]